MVRKRWSAVVVGLVAIGMVGAGASAATAAPAPRPGSAAPTIKTQGQGTARAQPIDVTAAAAAEVAKPLATPARTFGPLGPGGRPTGESLPAQPPKGTKPQLRRPGRTGPNTGAPVTPEQVRPFSAPSTINANFAGVTQAGSDCDGCQPPDPNAAVSPTQIAQVVNLRLQVYDKAGGSLCGVGLNALVGTSDSLSDPRIQWDNRYRRFSLVVIPVPASTTSTPTMYLLTSRSTDACGTWFVYTITFFGSLYPAGTLLDYPYLGQDRVALLSSSNNYRLNAAGGFDYLNSAVFSIPKAAAYSGAGFSLSAFAVGFSTAPVTVTGIPTAYTSATYFLRSIPDVGYQLYRMTSSAGPGTTVVAQPVAASTFAAPSRRVNQPRTAVTLDPMDGRIQASPFQDKGYVWFAHGQDISGYPGVRYGAISTSTNVVTAANAYRSNTSDDFNPSIGVADAGPGAVFAWLNWAYTDSPAGVATSTTVDGVLPGTGVPDLAGTGAVLVNGASTTSNTRFGDYSSVAIDPTAAGPNCPAGRTAVIAQQYFQSNGDWITRLGRLSFC